jgi:PAS domain S-box-containing protein
LYSTSHQRQEYFEVRISAVNDDLVILLVRNITEQTMLQTDIMHREHKYRALFEQNKDPVLLMTIEGIFIDANQPALNLTGYSRSELIGMSFRKLVHPSEMEQAEGRFAALQAGKLLPKYERSIVNKAGRKIRCEFNTARVDDVDGTPLHIQSILREITS